MTDIMLIGEAPSDKDLENGRAFSDTAGWILDGMLSQVGVSRSECYVTNVLDFHLRSNDIKNHCGTKKQGIPNMPALVKGKYLLAEHAPQLERLYKEIQDAQPNIIVPLGATATWALLRSTGIRKLRGATTITLPPVSDRLGRSYKVLPTYHPSAVARQWSIRPIVIADLAKAKRQSVTPVFSRPSRKIWIKPTLADLLTYEEQYLANTNLMACDIETKQEQITCIGFSPSPETAIVIPFFGESGANYWKTQEEEVIVWNMIRRWLAKIPTIFQNGLYDINFLWTRYGIPVPAAQHDTMLLHHAMQPEMEKGLGFLASIYSEEASWKHMIKGAAPDHD